MTKQAIGMSCAHPSVVPVALSPGGGLAEPGVGQDVRHPPPRDPGSRGDLRGEAKGAVDL